MAFITIQTVFLFRSSKRQKVSLLSTKKLTKRSVSTMQSLKISEEKKINRKMLWDFLLSCSDQIKIAITIENIEDLPDGLFFGMILLFFVLFIIDK